MIITDSVYQLVNELCSSLQQAEEQLQAQTIKQSTLKTLKSRMHEILLKTSPTNSNGLLVDTHELYMHELEFKFNGESAKKCSAMAECCRLVERDDYFRTDVGQSVMAFLLKLRNTGKCSDQVGDSVHVYLVTCLTFYVLERADIVKLFLRVVSNRTKSVLFSAAAVA